MTILPLLGLSALLGFAPTDVPVDTVVSVPPDRTVVLENFSGRILVGTWERQEVRVRGEGDARRPIRVSAGEGGLRIRGAGRGGHPIRGTVRLTIPERQPLEIQGRRLEARVEGTRGRLRIGSLHGSIELEGVSGDVEARTVHGTVRARDVDGRIALHSTDDDVAVVGGAGRITAGTVDGDVTLEEVRASEVRASSVDGDVRFSGALAGGGTYRLSTHDGDLTVTLDEPIDARVAVSTFDGAFSADFPVTLERFSGGREMRFTLGAGSAELTLEAFDGDIRLRRRAR